MRAEGQPGGPASAVSGRTPIPSTTTSAGYSASSVATARTHPSSPVRTLVTVASFTMVMPRPSMAVCTRRPMSGSSVDIGSLPRLRTVTSYPRLMSASAISTPMYPAPTTTARRPRARDSVSSRAWPSSRVCTPCTPCASIPGSSGRTGRAPVARTSRSYDVQDSAPESTSRARTRFPATSSSVTSVRRRRSMPRSRCSSGVRAISWSRSATSPPTQ